MTYTYDRTAADRDEREVSWYYDHFVREVGSWVSSKHGTTLAGASMREIQRKATGSHTFVFEGELRDGRTLKGEGSIFFNAPKTQVKCKVFLWIEGESASMGPLPPVLDKADKLAGESLVLLTRHGDLAHKVTRRNAEKALTGLQETVSKWRAGQWIDKAMIRSALRNVVSNFEGQRDKGIFELFRDAFTYQDPKTKTIEATIKACKKAIREIKG